MPVDIDGPAPTLFLVAEPGETSGANRPSGYPDETGEPRLRWDGSRWTEGQSDAVDPGALQDEQIGARRSGVGLTLAGAGAALIVIAVFLPRAESTTFSWVQDNTLIQSGEGWLFIGVALAVIFAVLATAQSQETTSSVFSLGLIAIVLATYVGTGDRLELTSVEGGRRFGVPQTETASPGAGIWAAGAGGLLVLLGGALLARWPFRRG